MDYVIVVYNKQGEEVHRKVCRGYSGNTMMEIYKDYAHLGGKGGYSDFFEYEEAV